MATTGGTAAQAGAFGTSLILQHAYAQQTSTTVANLASVSLQQCGRRHDSRELRRDSARWRGGRAPKQRSIAVSDGNATGKSEADAHASLTNDGTLNIAAIANATSILGTVLSTASAFAHVDRGIAQHATASVTGLTNPGTASVSLSNGAGGLISIGASAMLPMAVRPSRLPGSPEIVQNSPVPRAVMRSRR